MNSNEEKNQGIFLKLCIALSLLGLVVLLASWFLFQNSWAVNNYQEIVEKVTAVEQASADKDDQRVQQTYRELQDFICAHEIQEDFILQRLEQARRASQEAQQRYEAAEHQRLANEARNRQQAVEARKRELEQQGLRTVALSDERFAAFGSPVINNKGDVAFGGYSEKLREGEQLRGLDGIWQETRQCLKCVCRRLLLGTSVPGMEEGSWFMSFGRPGLSDHGDVVFTAYVFGGDVDLHRNASGVWFYSSEGELQLVAREDDQPPNVEPGARFWNILFPRINSEGHVVFESNLRTSDPESSIWTFRDGMELSLIARTGDAVPGVPKGITFGSIISSPVINDQGRVVFRAELDTLNLIESLRREDQPKREGGNARRSIDDFYLGSGIWVEVAENQLDLVVVSGTPAPGTSRGITFRSFDNPTINNAGQVLFPAALDGEGVNEFNGKGLWLFAGGRRTVLIARYGSQAPGLEQGTVFANLPSSYGGNLALNEAGHVAFIAKVTGSQVNRINARGVWSQGRTGKLRLIARSGAHAPGTPSGTNFAEFDKIVFSGSGQLVFIGGLIGRRVTGSNNWGIWAENTHGRLVLVVREGDTLDIGDLASPDLRTVRKLSFQGGSGNEAGESTGFNEHGQIAFAAEFSDGTSGVFVSNQVASE